MYERGVTRNRHVDFSESFGSGRVLKDTVTVKCTNGIPDQVRKGPLGLLTLLLLLGGSTFPIDIACILKDMCETICAHVSTASNGLLIFAE